MKYKIAIVGATGNVGRKMLDIILERDFPIKKIALLASSSSTGKYVISSNHRFTVQNLEEYDFSDTDIAFFSAGSSVSKMYVPKAVDQGCIVIDNSSYFRMRKDVPLIIPEVNLSDMRKEHKIIANPNCVVIQTLMAAKPLHDFAKIISLTIATYQSVSGAGQKAVQDLHDETTIIIHDKEKFYSKDKTPSGDQIAFNLKPQIGAILQNGYTEEEEKIISETGKILDSNIEVDVTCVRVPVFSSHSTALNFKLEKQINVNQAINLLQKMPGIVVDKEHYATPKEWINKNDVHISRIRQRNPNNLSLWVVGDNLLKGAALNAVQIAENILDIS